MDLKIIERIDYLVTMQATGSPAELAEKLKISERSVYNYISYLKIELEAPIIYSKGKQSYIYAHDGKIDIKFKKSE